MATQGEGYWIRAKDGKTQQVTRHEKWLKNDQNLETFDLLDYKPLLDEYSAFNPQHQDEIRLIGMKAGLVRVRDNAGTISVQFDLPRNAVTAALYNVAEALRAVNMWGNQVALHNLRYDDRATVPWKEFLDNTVKGERMLINEDGPGDVPYDRKLIDTIDAKLRRFGLDEI